MKTILITGASSGIGKDTAKYFLSKGWNVIASMRSPEKETELKESNQLKLIKIDVTNLQSISEGINKSVQCFGKIDVLLNNAGYAAAGAFECASDEQVRKQFDVNVFGLMNASREILPQFRKQKSGTIINVASVAGYAAVPGFSLYNSTKFAVEGFSEALSFELRPFNIKVKIIEPGPIKTDFFGRSMDVLKKENLNDYDEYISRVLNSMDEQGKNGKLPVDVAKTIYKAACSTSFKLRYPIGLYAKSVITSRRLTPDCLYSFIIRKMMKG